MRRSPRCGQARTPSLQLRNTRAKFYFVQDNEPQFYPAGAASGLVEETLPVRAPRDRQHPGAGRGLPRPTATQPCRSFRRSTSIAITRRRRPGTRRPVRVFFYGRPSTSRNSFGLGIVSLARLKERLRRPGRDHLRRRGLESRRSSASPGRIRNLGVLGIARRGGGAVPQLRHRPGVHADQAPELSAVGVHGLGHGHRLQHQPGHRPGCCATARTACSPRRCRRPTAERLSRLVDDAPLRQRIAENGLARSGATTGRSRSSGIWRAMSLRDGTGSAAEPPETRRATALRRSAAPRRLNTQKPEHADADGDPGRDEQPQLWPPISVAGLAAAGSRRRSSSGAPAAGSWPAG